MREILVWMLADDGYETVATIQNHLSVYLREHPGLKVYTKVRTPSSLWEDLFKIIKNPHHRPRPDLVQIPSHWTSTLAHLGLLQELREMDPQLDLRRWFLPAQDNCCLEGTGRIYSLPWWMELRALYYRKEILKDAGIDVKSLSSWDGFKSACGLLASKGRPQPVVNPNARESVGMSDLAPCVWSHGGDFFSADGARSFFQRPKAYQAIGDYFELFDKGWMPLKGQNGLAHKGIFEGGFVFEFAGRVPRARGRSRRAATGIPKDLGVVSFPSGGGGQGAALSVMNLAMLRDVEAPRDVYTLLRELVRETSAAGYARAIGALPATENELKKSLDAFPELCEVFRQAMGSMKTFPNLRVLGTLEKVFNRSMERLVSDVLHKEYAPEVLRRELIHAAAEIDYVLSLYG